MARNRQPAVVLLIALTLLSLLTLAALRCSLRIAIVPVAAVWMAIGCWCAEIQPAPSTQQALANYADGLSRQIRGRVVRVRELPPEHSDSDRDQEAGWWPEKQADEEAAATGALSIDIQVDSIEEVTPDISRMVPMSGGVRLNVIADKPPGNGTDTTATTQVFPDPAVRRCSGSPDEDQTRRTLSRPGSMAVCGLPPRAGHWRSRQCASFEDHTTRPIGRKPFATG